MGLINLVILFFLYSFIGWLIEVFEGIINRKEFVNRGFFIGPYCPIYGFGGLFISFLLKKYEYDYIALFVIGALICTILEYFTSLILEKIFNTRWWDYKDKKIHLNGRVCLEVMLLFGIATPIFIKIINPIILRSLVLPSKVKIFIFIIIILFFIVDLIISLKVLMDMRKNNMIDNKDITKKVNKRVKEVMKERGYFTKRLLNAFPLLRIKSKK